MTVPETLKIHIAANFFAFKKQMKQILFSSSYDICREFFFWRLAIARYFEIQMVT